MNTIAQIKTIATDGSKGRATAMRIAINISDGKTAEDFVSQVAEQFKLHRTLAPPDTSILLVTLIGELSADRFAARWKDIAQHDHIIRAYMSLMLVADVIQATKSGQQLSKASLLTD